MKHFRKRKRFRRKRGNFSKHVAKVIDKRNKVVIKKLPNSTHKMTSCLRISKLGDLFPQKLLCPLIYEADYFFNNNSTAYAWAFTPNDALNPDPNNVPNLPYTGYATLGKYYGRNRVTSYAIEVYPLIPPATGALATQVQNNFEIVLDAWPTTSGSIESPLTMTNGAITSAQFSLLAERPTAVYKSGNMWITGSNSRPVLKTFYRVSAVDGISNDQLINDVTYAPQQGVHVSAKQYINFAVCVGFNNVGARATLQNNPAGFAVRLKAYLEFYSYNGLDLTTD